MAFEMARQLEAAGEELAALVLIDTQIPRAAGRPGAAAFDDASVGFETFAADDLGLDLPAAELVPLGAAAALARVVEVAEDTGKLPHGHGAAILQGVKAVFQEAVLIAGRYKPRFLHNSLTLLRSRDPGTGGPSMGDFDWGRFCGAPITVHVVPGTHQTMVRPPYVEELARRLREALGASGASHRPTTHIDWADDQPPNNAPRSPPPRRRASEVPASVEPIRPGRSGDLGGG